MNFANRAVFLGGILALFGAAPAHALVIHASNATQAIVDGSSETRSVSFNAGDIAGAVDSIIDVNITIDFMKCAGDIDGLPLPSAAEGCPNAGSAWAREIVFLLTSPGGTTVALVREETYFTGGDGPDPGARIVVTFDDAAAVPVGGDTFADGTFQPVDLLASFNGESVLGDWELYIEDTSGGDALGFASFTLDITLRDATAQAPAPATALLFALGLGVAGALRRARP